MRTPKPCRYILQRRTLAMVDFLRETTVVVAAMSPVASIPAWTVLLPEGDPALGAVIRGLGCKHVKRLVFVALRQHVEDFCGGVDSLVNFIERQNPVDLAERVTVVALDHATSSAVDTVTTALRTLGIAEGPLFVKDADGAFTIEVEGSDAGTYCVGATVTSDNISMIHDFPRKAFMQHFGGLVTNIVEKKITSDVICVGGYGFDSVTTYVDHARRLSDVAEPFLQPSSRIFNSHVLLSCLAAGHVVQARFVDDFRDWKAGEALRRFAGHFQNVVVLLDEIARPSCSSIVFGAASARIADLVPCDEAVGKLRRAAATARTRVVILTSFPVDNVKDVETWLRRHNIPHDAVVGGTYHGVPAICTLNSLESTPHC
jgi:hypothetical protein